ncbi:MAG: protein O-mannosyl-transferase family [Limisphaerales bacterium]
MEKEKLLRWGLGLLVLALGLAAFGWTVAPTVSFWDCGEFIAASACLGIPHPPGAPLYVLIGRIFTFLPLGNDVGYRVNLISVLTSAFAGLVGYFLILKLFELWWPGPAGWFWKYLAAVSGALTMIFSNTFWSSAVEAEVYGLSMFFMLLLIYLTLRWYERRQTLLNPAPGGTATAAENGLHSDRYLILIYYLGLLSVAVHMTIFLVMPLIFLFVLWTDPEKRADFRFWAAGGSLLIILAVVEPFLVAVGLTLTASVVAYFLYGRKTAPWRLALLLSAFGLLGFSSQLYIPIRSLQNPSIDENNPESWERFKGFLERKQYGQENMLTRALTRRGKLENQFGRYPRMGFWGFFETQYGKGGWAFVPVFLIGLAGLFLPFRRDKKTALLLLAITLAGTIGLVFYMNFADGSRMDAYGEAGLEVRDRDYFWTPGFVVFSLAVGIGLGCLGMLLSSEEFQRKLKPPLPQAMAGLVVLAALAVPALALKFNFVRNSREGNYLPYDYAYNLLDSCDRDALLFTNGDNDTFPLWALQQAYGFRKDVRNINLSLLNTDWYILQLKKHMGVPISLADSQIAMKDLPMPGMAQTFPRPEHPYRDRRRGISHYLMPVQLDKQLLRVQDFMVEEIVLSNDFKYPLFFSRTVPGSARVGLDANLETEGMVLRLLPERKEERFDFERTEKLLWENFRFRNFNNPEVTLDDNDAGMMIVYPEIALELYEWYLRKNDTIKAFTHLERSVREFPFYPRTVVLLHDYYKSKGEIEKSKQVAERSRRHLEKAVRRSAENPVWWMFLSNLYQLEGKKEEAYRAIQTAWEINRAEDFIFRTYVQYCLADGRSERLVKLAREWLENHPNDEFSQQVLSQFGGVPQLPQGLPSR